MESQTSLDIGIGKTETITLSPKSVRVEKVEIRNVEIRGKQNEKLVAFCKHPDRDDLIEVSQVKYEKKGKLEVVGLWVKKDKEELLLKNIALSVLLNSVGAKTMRELQNKEIPTILDDNGFLAFKAY